MTENGGFTADVLMQEDIPEMKWTVPGLIPEGVSLLGGKPKTGKSWLALGLCLATATGGYALGAREVEQGDALYLALEDNKRRLQTRLGHMLGEEPGPSNLHFSLDWNRLDNGGLKDLDNWLSEHPDTRLVVIDVLQKIRKLARGNAVYQEDYEAAQCLVPLAAEHNVAILVVHHVRKEEATDPLDMFNASTGLTAAVDSGVILHKESNGATLSIRGRDVEESDYALAWDAELSGWRITGEAVEKSRMSGGRQAILHALETADKTLGPKEVALAAGLEYDVVKNLLPKMANSGQIVKVSRGEYGPVTSITSVTSTEKGNESNGTANSTVTFETA